MKFTTLVTVALTGTGLLSATGIPVTSSTSDFAATAIGLDSDLPPLIIGEGIPIGYLIRAGIPVDLLSSIYYPNTTPSINSTTMNNSIHKRATSSICNTSIGSPILYDVFHAIDKLGPIVQCGQRNGWKSSCTTMQKAGSAAIGICGVIWEGECAVLGSYLRGVAGNCQNDFNGLIKTGGSQFLNVWEINYHDRKSGIPKDDPNQPFVVVFHS